MSYITTVNPATEKPIKRYEVFTKAEIDNSIRRARAVFDKWKNTDIGTRAKLIKNYGRVLLKRKKALAELITNEMGKPISQTIAEIEKCAWLCDYISENAKDFLKDEIVETEAKKSYISFEPLGTIACIMPWNFPFWQALRFAIPAIAAGNAVVLKHSSTCVGTSIEIQKVFEQAGFPKGVFQSIVATPKEGEYLVTHKGINAVSVTGSVGTGRKVYSLAAQHLKKCVLELGGSDPFIVLDDADMQFTCEQAVRNRLVAGGQSCIAAKRFIITRKSAKEFTELFVDIMKAQKIGNPLEMDTNVGPMAKLGQLETLDKQVKKSVKMGAKVLAGGKRLQRSGFFYEPTVLTSVKRTMPVWREETFGPVAPIYVVSNEKEAIKEANNTDFGLGASIWTRNKEKGEKLAKQIEAGLVFVNGHVKSDPRMPFGGVKQSGIGRELSRYGMLEFVNIKTIKVN